jgi:cytochrome oxidase Cu insertion factor (SCO1/SenC/PrrC family)
VSLLISACAPATQPEISPGVEYPEASGFRVISREEIDPPVPAFDFSLTDQTGETLTLKDLRGSVVMITFLYRGLPLSGR